MGRRKINSNSSSNSKSRTSSERGLQTFNVERAVFVQVSKEAFGLCKALEGLLTASHYLVKHI